MRHVPFTYNWNGCTLWRRLCTWMCVDSWKEHANESLEMVTVSCGWCELYREHCFHPLISVTAGVTVKKQRYYYCCYWGAVHTHFAWCSVCQLKSAIFCSLPHNTWPNSSHTTTLLLLLLPVLLSFQYNLTDALLWTVHSNLCSGAIHTNARAWFRCLWFRGTGRWALCQVLVQTTVWQIAVGTGNKHYRHHAPADPTTLHPHQPGCSAAVPDSTDAIYVSGSCSSSESNVCSSYRGCNGWKVTVICASPGCSLPQLRYSTTYCWELLLCCLDGNGWDCWHVWVGVLVMRDSYMHEHYISCHYEVNIAVLPYKVYDQTTATIKEFRSDWIDRVKC
jgi:hypothetical protein